MLTVLSPDELQTVQSLREQELEEARAIQGVMLPGQPLCTSGVTISHEFQPAAEVGGDFLDYFLLSDETIGLYIGDVSGKLLNRIEDVPEQRQSLLTLMATAHALHALCRAFTSGTI